MNRQSDVEGRSRHPACGSGHYETVIIGGGQAGLSVGYHLARRGRPFVILDTNEQIGDSWRKRWDSLRLFTPACLNGLPGWPFPASAWSFPEMAGSSVGLPTRWMPPPYGSTVGVPSSFLHSSRQSIFKRA